MKSTDKRGPQPPPPRRKKFCASRARRPLWAVAYVTSTHPNLGRLSGPVNPIVHTENSFVRIDELKRARMLGMSKGPSPLTLRQLEIFREAARLGNFRDASKALRISPTAIGQPDADLERALGENVGFFDRSQTGSQLTDAGRVLLEHGDRMLLEEA